MARPNDFSVDVRQLLLNSSDGSSNSTADWAVWVGLRPDSTGVSDKAISLFTFPGPAPNPKWNLDTVACQVSVRGGKYEYSTASQKIQDIKDTLLGVSSQTVNGTRYVGITCPNDIGFLTYDENQRPIFRLDVTSWREPSNSTSSNRQDL